MRIGDERVNGLLAAAARVRLLRSGLARRADAGSIQ